jgi:O-antigen ligase
MGKVMTIKERFLTHPVGIYLFAFLLPIYPKFYTLGILLLLIDLIIRRVSLRQKNHPNTSIITRFNSGAVLFFILHLTGILYSSNTTFAWSDIGMKASFVLFPIIFLFYPKSIDWENFGKSFIAGAVFSIILCLTNAAITYWQDGFVANFFDSHLSFLMHRSYWATYLVMAYSLTWFLYNKKLLSTIISVILLLLFSLLTFMSGSKMGILVLIFTTLAWVIYVVIKKKAFIMGAISLVLFLIIGGGTYTYSPQLQTRIQAGVQSLTSSSSISPTSTESNAARILVWSSALDEIKEHPIWGVGTGDIKDELYRRNLANGYTGVAEMHLNAHNQFLNSYLAIGILGLMSLVLSFLIPFRRIKGEHQFVVRSLVVILFLSLLTESFFETQAGIVPGAFILCLIANYSTTSAVKD